MNLQAQINKIKITFFGNIWIVRLVKLLRYVVGGILARLIWKSEYIFGKQTPAQVFKTFLDWSTKNVNDILYNVLTMGYFIAFLIFYFYLSGKLVEWLITINIPASQQDKVFQEKSYLIDNKTSYSVKQVNDLEITGFRNSAFINLYGKIFLQNKQGTKQIAFVIHSYKQTLQEYLITNKFKDYLPNTNIRFREKTFLTWQKVLVLVSLMVCGGFFVNRYLKGKAFPETAIGDVLSGENDRQRRQVWEEEEKKKSSEERKKYIVDSRSIKTTWNSIGGLKRAKERIQTNLVMFDLKKKIKDFPSGPQHVLLYGPPGTGKTLLAQAAAKHSGSFFAYATGGQFAGKDRKEREDKINLFLNGVIKETKEEPCILFIDEFDKMNSDPEDFEKCTEWNTIMDGIDKQKFPGLTLIVATNKAERLDLSILRSERFGIKLLITFPEKDELKDIIKTNLNLFYEDMKTIDSAFFGNKNKEVFVREFTEFMFKEISENKDYLVDPNEMLAGAAGYDPQTGEPKKVFEEDEFPPRPLFVGADIRRMIYEEAPAITRKAGRKAITNEDIKEAIKIVNEDSKALGLQQKEMQKFLREMLLIKGKKRGFWY